MMTKIILPTVGATLLMANIAMANDEKISGLMFIPKERVWHGNSFVKYARSTYDAGTAEVKDQTTTFNQEIGLGLTDRLSYKLEFSTIIDNETETKDVGPATTLKIAGIREPGIEFKYRFDSIIPWAKKFDMAINYSPRFKDAKRATSAIEGLNYRGNHEIGATAQVGEEISSTRSWMAEVHFSYFTKTATKDRNTGMPDVFTYTDHAVHATAGFTWQEMLMENLGVNAGTNLIYESKETYSGDRTGSKDAAFGLGLGADIFWNYKTKIQYYGNLGLTKMTNRDQKIGNTTTVLESRWDSSASVGAKYLF